MHFTSSLASLALVGLAFSNPITSPVERLSALERRAQVDCGGGYRFLTSAQDKAYNDAIAHLDAGTTVTGSNNKDYPEYYGDSPAVGLPASCKQSYNDLRIYPIYVQDTTTFTAGSNPGADRVVISRHTDGTRERCGIISHRDQATGQFKFCGI